MTLRRTLRLAVLLAFLAPVLASARTEVKINVRVSFAPGKSAVPAAAAEELRQLVRVMAEHPELPRIEVQGHSDARECKPDDLRLSQARADAVMARLVELGADPARLRAVGHGGTRPLTHGKRARDRAMNRRVDFHFRP
jgi:OOP family OmpA-OmpF porin